MSDTRNKRNIKIEIIRVIACLAVVWYHIRELPFKTNGEISETAIFFECVCTICVMSFFLITGFFIYNKKNSILIDWIKLIEKYILQIFIPFIFIAIFTIIFHEYLISRATFIECIQSTSIQHIVSTLFLSIKSFSVDPLPGTAAHLWYVYSYGLIIIAYPITRYILTKCPKYVSYIVLFIITIFMVINDYNLLYNNPSFNVFFEIIPKPVYYSAWGHILYNDIMKKYIDRVLNECQDTNKVFIINVKLFVTAILIYITTFILLFLTELKYVETVNNGYVYTSWLSLYALILTSAFVLIVYDINIERFLTEKIENLITFVSSKTLGIYLVHYLIVTKLISTNIQGRFIVDRTTIFHHLAFYIFYGFIIFILSLISVCIIESIISFVKNKILKR